MARDMRHMRRTRGTRRSSKGGGGRGGSTKGSTIRRVVMISHTRIEPEEKGAFVLVVDVGVIDPVINGIGVDMANGIEDADFDVVDVSINISDADVVLVVVKDVIVADVDVDDADVSDDDGDVSVDVADDMNIIDDGSNFRCLCRQY